ncbi:MAG: phosphatase PAP2 family protein [Candidatus Aminicenantes bacterium]|nr:phosphatase PAP2 family protein [Candidatus Aminicenantes bacterium]
MKRMRTEVNWRRRAGIMAIGILTIAIGAETKTQAAETADEYKLDRSFMGRFGRDFRDVISSPGHWDGRDLLTLAAVSGTGLFLFAFDQDIRVWTQDQRSPSSDKGASFFGLLGNGGVLLGISAAVYAAGEIGDEVGLRKTAILSLESLAAASILDWTIKMISGRARPYTDESSRRFHPFSFKNSYWSFPSGHAVASFAVATAIAEQAKSPLVDVVVYGLASLAGISRIYENKHWASDVFIGAALGYFVGQKICDLNSTEKGSAVSLGLDCTGSRRALTLKVAF